MKLIDRYVTEVGKHLSKKSRADIEAELRSTLEDMLEDRSRKARRPADDEMVKEMLKEFGAPEKVAASYLPENYLIGPRLYPFFLMVVKIVFSVLLVLGLVGLGIKVGTTTPMTSQVFIQTLAKGSGDLVMAVIQAFGNIVIVFAILQRVMPKAEFEIGNKEEWDPADLLKEPEPDEIHIWEPIFSIVFTVAALLLFNVYPQLIGVGFLSDGKWTFIPALTDAFFRFMPWINLLWVLQIALQVILLRQGRWQLTTRVFSVGLDIFGLTIAYALLTGPSIVGISQESLAASTAFDPNTAGTLASLFHQLPQIILLVIIIVEGIEIVKTIYRLLVKKSIPILPIMK